jgi:hypothetical protein
MTILLVVSKKSKSKSKDKDNLQPATCNLQRRYNCDGGLKLTGGRALGVFDGWLFPVVGWM